LTHSILICVSVEGVLGDQLAALDSLEKSVMQFLCEAGSLCEAFIEAGTKRRRDLLNTEGVDAPD
jgi:hypothetical protein